MEKNNPVKFFRSNGKKINYTIYRGYLNNTFHSREVTLDSNKRYVLALVVVAILVTGTITLPLAFYDHMAYANKKKQKVTFENISGNGGNGGNGGISSGGPGGSAISGNGGDSIGGNGGISGDTGSANGGNGGWLVGLAAMLTHLLIAATAVLVAMQQVAVQQVEASLQAQLVVMGEVPTTAARTGALVEPCYWRISVHHRW